MAIKLIVQTESYRNDIMFKLLTFFLELYQYKMLKSFKWKYPKIKISFNDFTNVSWGNTFLEIDRLILLYSETDLPWC